MSLRISRILHAGYILEYKGRSIAFDPIFENPFSKNCFAFPEVQFDSQAISELSLDAVIISHYHDDHLSLESLNLLQRSVPIYLYTVHQEFIDLLKELGFQTVHVLQVNQMIEIGGFKITPLEALDCDVDSLFHIHVDNINILNVVDSWIPESTLNKLCQIQPWDLVLWPFQTMRELEVISLRGIDHPPELPQEWLEQLAKLKPKYIIPSSCQFIFEKWSWYNQIFFPISYKIFEHVIKSLLPQTEVIRLNPGESLISHDFRFQKKGRLAWIHPVGEQNVDYHFDPKTVPQSVAEVAQKIASLDFEQKQKVNQFCEKDILNHLLILSQNDDSAFFKKEQFWKLIIYDEQGGQKEYGYLLAQNSVKKVDSLSQVTWLTEIPEAKLFSALYEGDSLTSLYIRVTPVDHELDLLEDPLMSCLYNGAIGAYQKAQLQRIRNEKGID